MKEGFRGLTRLTRLDSLQASHRLTVEAMLNGVTDYRFYAVIINKSDAHTGRHSHETRE